MGADNIIKLTDKTFDAEAGRGQKPLLVDFWAEWCGPCRAIAKVVDELAAAHSERLRVGKMNIDEERETPARLRVEAIPTLVLFRSGEEVDRIVGLVNRAKIEEMLSRHLG